MRANAVHICLIAALSAAPALAAESGKMEAPKPPAELSQLSVFDGTWSCKGTGFASPFGPEHATEATVKSGRAVGGMWVHMTYDERKTAANPVPVHAALYLGFDAAQKKFVLGCVDSFGGYCTETSEGWKGDVLAFEGTATVDGKKVGSRDTFTRKGKTEIGHEAEMQGPDGKWMRLDAERCTK